MTNVANDAPLDALREAVLLEAMAEPGCALCRCVWQDDVRSQTWYVNEGAVDNKTLVRVRRALGFCGWHAVTLAMLEGQAYVWSHLGSALLHDDIMQQRVLPGLRDSAHAHANGARQRGPGPLTRLRLQRLLHPGEGCPACVDRSRAEPGQIATFADALVAHAAFRTSYGESAGLCLPHLLAVVRHLRASKASGMVVGLFPALAQPTRRRIAQIGELLSSQQGDRALGSGMCSLYGANTCRWAAYRSRLEVDMQQGEWWCPACAAVDTALAQGLGGLLAAPTLPYVCDWHGWLLARRAVSGDGVLATWLEHTIAVQVRRLDACLASPTTAVSLALPSCALCMWHTEQEPALVRAWWQCANNCRSESSHVALCLSHGRLLLGAERRTAGNVVSVLLQSAEELAWRITGYIRHCSEAEQARMQPEEARVWRGCARWFGGLMGAEALDGLSEASPADE
jgi:hypothetical protein